MDKINVFAPASVSNVGPGFDILGFPVNGIGDWLTAIKRDAGFGIKITEAECKDCKLPKAVGKNTAGVAARNILKALDKPFGVELKIKKNFGVGTGLGSSASSAVAAVYAINKLAGSPFNKEELLQFAMEGEKIASGNYHADNVAPSLLGGFILIRSYNPLDLVKFIPQIDLFTGLFVPKIKVETKSARAVLKKNVSLTNTVAQTGNIAAMILSLVSGNKELLRDSVEDSIIEPQRANFFPHFYTLKEIALQNHALGCSISGSGPTVFFFTDSKEKAKSILLEMESFYLGKGIDSDKYISKINRTGVKTLK